MPTNALDPPGEGREPGGHSLDDLEVVFVQVRVPGCDAGLVPEHEAEAAHLVQAEGERGLQAKETLDVLAKERGVRVVRAARCGEECEQALLHLVHGHLKTVRRCSLAAQG
jgi:hypothetical protein